MTEHTSRRGFLGATAGLTAGAGFSVLADPAAAAAGAVGVKSGDLPDLTIKEVKVYVSDVSKYRRLNSTETGEILSVVTASGIEGNYTIGNRNLTKGWLEWAKARLLGKSVIDVLPTLTSTSGMKGPAGFDSAIPRGRPGAAHFVPSPPGPGWTPAFGGDAVEGSGLMTRGGGTWPNFYAAAADVCLWDILGKAVDRPIYKILGGGTTSKDKVLAYASSQHLDSIEDYVADVLKAKAQGYKGYKIHPGAGQHAKGALTPSYIGHMEEIREVRKAVGDEYVLMHDPVQRYSLYEAMTVGRLLDELNFLWYEDPVQTNDQESLIKLCAALDLAIHVGEFIYSVSDFADYIKKDALDVVRLIADNVGGISGGMRVGLLADAHGLECTPHNWGNGFDLALHLQLELALPNAYWFEMPFVAEYADRDYLDYKFRIDEDGYIAAPTAPGLGLALNMDALHNSLKRIDR